MRNIPMSQSLFCVERRRARSSSAIAAEGLFVHGVRELADTGPPHARPLSVRGAIQMHIKRARGAAHPAADPGGHHHVRVPAVRDPSSVPDAHPRRRGATLAGLVRPLAQSTAFMCGLEAPVPSPQAPFRSERFVCRGTNPLTSGGHCSRECAHVLLSTRDSAAPAGLPPLQADRPTGGFRLLRTAPARGDPEAPKQASVCVEGVAGGRLGDTAR